VGQATARVILQTPGLRLVAAVDPAPAHAGKDLGAVLGLPRKLRIRVERQPERFYRKARGDVAFVCTSSLLKEVKPQIAALLASRMNVITTCEELAYPAPAHAAEVRELDRLARRQSLGQFRRAVTDGAVRHVGLVESAYMIAGALGWKLDRVDEALEPAIAPRDLDTDYLRIPAGAAAGIRQAVRAYRGGELAVSLDLQVYVGAEAPRDHVLVDGDPPVDATIAGGINGERAAAAILVNSLPRVLAAPPGLLTVRELPLVHCLNPQSLAAAPPRKR
jgi:hypothetical protein